MAFEKIKRDECQVYFVVPDDPRMVSRWRADLSLHEIKAWKDAESKFWKWQMIVEARIDKEEKIRGRT